MKIKVKYIDLLIKNQYININRMKIFFNNTSNFSDKIGSLTSLAFISE